MSVLLRWSLNVLLEMSTDSRAKCLSTESSIVDIDGVTFEIPVMVTRWDPCSIVNDVAQNITSQKHDFIEPEYMEIVAAAIVNSTSSLDQEKERWKRCFARTGLRDYVFVAMCDPECCDHAIRTWCSRAYLFFLFTYSEDSLVSRTQPNTSQPCHSLVSLTRNNTTRIFNHKLEHQRSNTGTSNGGRRDESG